MDNHEERIEEWADHLTAAYLHIAEILKSLDLPIRIPTNFDNIEFVGHATKAMTRALTLIMEQPMDKLACSALFQCLLDWLTAIDLVAAELDEPQEWREYAFAYTMRRMLAESEMARARINSTRG